MLARGEETNLVLNWEKCHFMVKEGIVLGHKISKAGIEVDKSKRIVTRTNVDYAKLLWEEFVQGIQTFFTHQDSNKIPSKKPTSHVIPYCRFTKLIIYYLGSKYNIHRRPESPRHVTGDDFLLGNLKFVPKAKEGGKKKTTPNADKPVKPALTKPSKSATVKQPKPKPVKEKSIKHTPLQKAGKGKVTKVRNMKSSLQLVDEPDEEQAQPKPEPQGAANIIRDTLSPTDAKTGADTDKTNSEGDTEILNIGGEQGEDVANKEDLEGKTAEIDESQAGSNPSKTPESRPQPEYVRMEEDQAGPNHELSHVAFAGPDPEPMHDDFVASSQLIRHQLGTLHSGLFMEDEMLVGMPGAPATDETELDRRLTDFITMVRQDTEEIYRRLDDAQDNSDKMVAETNFTTLTAKLPILNPGDYDLWLMRIDQYFLLTDYSLWEVIKNGNKVLKRTVGETEHEYEPTTTEEKQDRRNEMKSRGTLLMTLPNKDQLKFHSYKDAIAHGSH
ncbi:hypothetical protein Tco_0586579 [Tanacetum coccineum]